MADTVENLVLEDLAWRAPGLALKHPVSRVWKEEYWQQAKLRR